MQLLEVEKNLITHNVTIKHVNIGELASGFLTLGEVQVQHYHQSHISMFPLEYPVHKLIIF